MPAPTASRLQRFGTGIGQVAAGLVAIVAAISLLGSCAGERPSLGAQAPQVPATTAIATTTTAPEVDDGILGPDDLLGWIATPDGEPSVFAEPSSESERVEIGAETSAGAPTTFAIVGDASPDAIPAVPGWYQVALPTRPNGSTGWVPAASVTVAKTPFRLFVDLDGRKLRVEEDEVEVYAADVAVGTSDNPTPTNGTFLTELIQNENPSGSYGPYAFGLAMHSDTLTEFNGGPGQVGIHGTNQPDLIGQAVSHGCVRLANADIDGLVDLQLPLGAPVFIT